MNSSEPRQNQKHELPRGTSVGKYEILRKIATGGMAEIYLARVRGTAGFEKMVVLKRILPQVAEDPTFVQMFLDEARLSSTLQHPNIADVYDVGEADGQYFFTMEFVHGQDVRTIRHEMKKRSEPVPLPASLAVVHGAATALDYAHNKRASDGSPLGLVHRDVSASNVMVSYDGAVKLLDFGIARVRSATHKTQVGTLKGKIPYMSPEQCKGLPLDRRSDLFSLGVVLYELTVGRRPFRGDSDFAIMDQIVYQGAPPPSSLVNGYPAELEAIVMKCLERDPKARFNSCDELGEDLEAFTQKYSLWISPKQLGKYMRTVFADKIKAWEDAEKAGVPFIQHVAESITSQSQQSEMLTPPSAFPALPARPSQVMAAQSPEIQQSLRPTPTSMQAAEPPKSIDALHQKLGQKPVPGKPITKPMPAVAPPAGAIPATKRGTGAVPSMPPSGAVARPFVPLPAKTPAPRASSPGYAPPAQLPFQPAAKSGDGWEAATEQSVGENEFGNESPTMSQPEEDLARALAADPDAGATMRAPSNSDLDAAATFQGMKAATVAKAAGLGTPPAQAKTLYGYGAAPLTPPSRSEFADDQATKRAPTPPPRDEFGDDQATKRAPSPSMPRASSSIDDEQITEKPIRIGARAESSAFSAGSAPLDAPAFTERTAIPAHVPQVRSAAVPSLKPSGSRTLLIALAALLVVGGGIAGYLVFAGGGTKAAPAALDQGSEVKATSTPVEPPTPAQPAPTQPAVAPAQPATPETKPEPTPPEPTKAEPTTPESAQPEPTKPEPAKTPVKTKTPVKAPVKQVTPVHKSAPQQTPKKKDQNWDPNSPFLPGQ